MTFHKTAEGVFVQTFELTPEVRDICFKLKEVVRAAIVEILGSKP